MGLGDRSLTGDLVLLTLDSLLLSLLLGLSNKAVLLGVSGLSASDSLLGESLELYQEKELLISDRIYGEKYVR